MCAKTATAKKKPVNTKFPNKWGLITATPMASWIWPLTNMKIRVPTQPTAFVLHINTLALNPSPPWGIIIETISRHLLVSVLLLLLLLCLPVATTAGAGGGEGCAGGAMNRCCTLGVNASHSTEMASTSNPKYESCLSSLFLCSL
jgi:hypothetical protein